MAKQLVIFEREAYEVVGVPIGFSWPALLFGSFWAISKRAWRLFAWLLASEVLLWFGSGYAAESRNLPLMLAFFVVQLGYLVIRGMYGNRWLAASLRSRGYRSASARPRT